MRSALLALFCLAAVSPQAPPTRPLPFSEKGWELRGDRTAVVEDGGREVLDVTTGFAFRRDVLLQDGTIDLEVQVTRRRSFVYLYFRAVEDGEREEVYLRPHKSGLPDALQYAPVWQNRSAWQLHHGPGGTAAVDFEPGSWMPLRLVVQGRRAALFVGNLTEPALLVPRLAREPQAGYLAIGAFVPAGAGIDGPAARFRNVVVKPDAVPFDFDAALARSAAAGEPADRPDTTVVRAWAVSRAFVPGKSEVGALPPSATLGSLQRIEAGPDGLVQLHRHVPVPGQGGSAAAVARVRVRAPTAGTYTFDLGFSDIATVFVNGRPVFQGDASYSFDRPRREGLIGFDQARLYLPLEAGENELAVLVSDSFGGWGLMGRFVSASGISVEPR